ncbi:hypothetical protein CDL15_Pgr022850 [Punica granatum]|uniref:PTC1-like winged helix-turn-helix domain-containing protein n=1 Tax=Punica granatum TaxID=22663 RepID=A0A218X3U8_PUNGR|nr:hypothetical protein CDL15_Pgr022850 [Punica granatum]
MEMQVGSFYEINHALLAVTKHPEQLKLIRVVMVSEKTKVSVSLRFPSIYSLRMHFNNSNTNRTREGTKKLPPFDEKYVISSDVAAQLLLKRVSATELTEKKDSWSFWTMTSSSCSSPTVSTSTATSPPPPPLAPGLAKKGTCWSQLKCSGMVRWGKRRQVRFLSLQDKTSYSLNLQSQSGGGGDEEKEKDGGERWKEVEADNLDKREASDKNMAAYEIGEGLKQEGEEEHEADDETEDQEEETKERKKAERTPTQWSRGNDARRRSSRKRKASATSRSLKVKRAKPDNAKSKTQVVGCAPKNKGKTNKTSTERWSAERYKLAEQNMLKILKEKGAVYGNPILRPALRLEARKLIGDTGLLDHLLKHMAGKVAPGGTERFRRRHNADGAMEYWLESSDLVNIRKEAGVQDPYWTPPPGWKLGDSPSQDPVCAREIKFLREEIAKLKGEMQELISKKQEEILTPVTIKPTDQERIGLPPKEMYTELIRKKSAMEEQLKEISRYLSMMKLMQEDMESLKSTVGETRVSELEEPITPVGTEAGGGERMKVGEEKDKVADDVVAAMVPMEEDEVEENMKRTRTAAEDKAAKIQRLKSGFRICKPQGTFLWPSMAMSSLSPHYAVEDLLVVPTPPSAPSSPPSHHQLQPSNGLVGAAQPTSPVKPLAEKRMLSVAAATPEMAQSPTETPKATTPTPSRNPAFVAMGSFSPAKKPSASPLVQQEHSEGTNDTANATPVINLNELPSGTNYTISRTYKRRHHIPTTATSSAAISRVLITSSQQFQFSS